MGTFAVWHMLVLIGFFPTIVFAGPLAGTAVLLNPFLIGAVVTASQIFS